MFDAKAFTQHVLANVTDDHKIHTPLPLIDEMLAHIPLTNKRILVVCNLELVYALAKLGVSGDNVWFYSPCNLKGQGVQAIMPNATVISKPYEAFAEHDFGMKFDVVIGNPPYQKGANSKFYVEFIEKAKLLSDQVAFVIPSSFFKRLSNFKGVSVYRYLDLYFENVSISVCYFVYEKGASRTVVIDHQGNKTVQETVTHLVTSSLADYEIFKKFASKDGLRSDTGVMYENQAIFVENDGIKVIFRAGKRDQDFDWKFVDKSQRSLVRGLGSHKVVFSGINGGPFLGNVKYAGPDFACSSGCAFLEVENENQARNLITYLHSPLARFLIKTAKGKGNKNSRRILASVPAIDLNRSWSNADLYEFFGIDSATATHLESVVNDK